MDGKKVFISSTSQDLFAYRQSAIEVCNRLQLVPIAMEFFSAMGKGATEGSKLKIADSDVYIGIFAHRYGYIEDGYEKSVTEIEFDYAGEKHLERLCFLVDPGYPWPPDAIDYANSDKLEAFKNRINNSLIRAQFKDVVDFKSQLLQALQEWKVQNGKASLPQDSPKETPLTMIPPTPPLLVGRADDGLQLKKRLGIDAPRQPLTIIRGWPGVGKTTLLSSLVYDKEVIQAFPDGILWASVGEKADPFTELMKWGRAIGNDMSYVKTLADAIEQLRLLLKNKQLLLVVDDIWETDAALPYKQVAGPNSVTLITTRFGDIARELALTPSDIYVLGTLGIEEGFKLLQFVAPKVTTEYSAESRELVENLEGLPLALRVAGRLLEAELAAGFDIKDSFNSLRESSELLKSQAPDDRFDPHTGTTPTVGLLLRKSTDRLDEFTRDCFAFLGAFAPKPATFDLAAMQGVWMLENDEVKRIVLKLVDRGLLEPIPSLGRFWMHAILVMHALQLCEEN